MAGTRVAGRRVPAGAEGAGPELSDHRDPRRGLRRDLARPDLVQRRRDPGEGRGSGRDPPRPAGRSRRHAQPLHRSGSERHRRRLPVPAQRQSAARAEVRIQAQVVRAADRARARRCTRRASRSCCCGDYNVVPTDFDIYDPKGWKKDALLQPETRDAYQRLLAQGWIDSLRKLPSGGAHLHVLGLLPQSLAAQRRPAHRSPAAERDARAAAGRAATCTRGCAARRRRAITRRSAWRSRSRAQPRRRRSWPSGSKTTP